MKGVGELVLALCDLAEAEGKVLRKNVLRTGKGCTIWLMAFFFLTIALLFGLAALYDILSKYLPNAVIFGILAAISAMLAVVFYSFYRKITLQEKLIHAQTDE